MSSYVREIDEGLALFFLKGAKAEKEQVTITSSYIWLGFFKNEWLEGVVGINESSKKARIKSLYVLKKYRRAGIGTLLVMKAAECCEEREVTAFATTRSRGIFEKLGFEAQWTNKNGITFLRKEKKNV